MTHQIISADQEKEFNRDYDIYNMSQADSRLSSQEKPKSRSKFREDWLELKGLTERPVEEKPKLVVDHERVKCTLTLEHVHISNRMDLLSMVYQRMVKNPIRQVRSGELVYCEFEIDGVKYELGEKRN